MCKPEAGVRPTRYTVHIYSIRRAWCTTVSRSFLSVKTTPNKSPLGQTPLILVLSFPSRRQTFEKSQCWHGGPCDSIRFERIITIAKKGLANMSSNICFSIFMGNGNQTLRARTLCQGKRPTNGVLKLTRARPKQYSTENY